MEPHEVRRSQAVDLAIKVMSGSMSSPAAIISVASAIDKFLETGEQPAGAK